MYRNANKTLKTVCVSLAFGWMVVNHKYSDFQNEALRCCYCLRKVVSFVGFELPTACLQLRALLKKYHAIHKKYQAHFK